MSLETIKRKAAFHKDFWILFAILGVTFVLYLNSFPKEFTNWDDPEYVVTNSLIRSFSFQNLNRMIAAPYFANYAPLTLISYALDYHFWKLNPLGYQLHNLLLHLACTLVLYFLLRRFNLTRGVIIASTLLFAIHPINVESVSWISERKNLLAAFFFLLSFHSYICYREVQSRVYYLSSILFFLLSIISKASTLVAPMVFLAYDYCYNNVKRGQERVEGIRNLRLFDKLPYIVFAEILTFMSIHAAGKATALHSYHEGGPLLSLFGSGHLFKEYLSLILWPVNLSALYIPRTAPSFGNVHYWIPLLIFLTASGLFLAKSKNLFFWLTFFVFFLIPVMNLIPLPVMMADRYLYISEIGVWVILSTLVLRIVKGLRPWKLARGTILGLVGCWLLILMVYTIEGTKVWRNSYNLWTNVLNKDFYNEVAHHNLGLWCYDHKQFNRAGLEFRLSLGCHKDYHLALLSLANYYAEKGQVDLAIAQLYRVLDTHPDHDVAINNLGTLMIRKGDVRRALFFFFRATYVNPHNIHALNNIVVLYLKTGKPDVAMEYAQDMIRKFPEAPDGYFKLGLCLAARESFSEALDAYEEASKRTEPGSELRKQIDTDMAEARQKLVLKQAERSL